MRHRRFDIYPVSHENPASLRQAWISSPRASSGVKWTEGRKIVWNTVECTRSAANTQATPKQVKAEVWMSLVHGSRGIQYFVTAFKPKFNEHALLDDPEMLPAVTAINKQILNSRLR